MSAPLVGDIEILHECSPCYRYRVSYMSAPLVADIEILQECFSCYRYRDLT